MGKFFEIAWKLGMVASDNDLPADDGNACTTEVCNAGMPGHPAKGA